MASLKVQQPPQVFSLTSFLALSALVLIGASAWGLSVYLLPKNASRKNRALFIWHAFDASLHFFIEGAYLYNCFFVYALRKAPGLPLQLPSFFSSGSSSGLRGFDLWTPMTPPGTHFLGRTDRLYGAFYGDNLTSKLWREYAAADRRWGGTDLGVISLELLTVFVMAPIAVAVCESLRREKHGQAFFLMSIVATGELYGGFMTFCPEWLTGSPNLDTSNFLFKWVYLVFLNVLWVIVPGWILYEAYKAFSTVSISAQTTGGKATKAKKSH